jgi:hypothetical protein
MTRRALSRIPTDQYSKITFESANAGDASMILEKRIFVDR